MATLSQPEQSRQYPSAPPNPMQQSTSAEPDYPFPPSSRYLQYPEVLPLTNGMARTGSTRRGTGGNGQVAGVVRPPPAPEVPKGPPVSYRSPYENEAIPIPQTDKSSSFAARARAFPRDVGSGNGSLASNGIAAAPQQSTPARRSSMKRPAAIYDPIEPRMNEQEKGPVTATRLPQQSEYAESSTQPRTRAPVQTNPANEENAPVQHEIDEATLSRSDTKRTTAARTDSRKAWAADRSPLQKLEVKLNDISKEEKRARVQEAEQLLRERIASQARGDVSQKPQTSVKTSQIKRLSAAQEDGRRGDGEQHSPRHVPGEMYTQIRQAGTKYPRAKRDSLNNKDLSISDYGVQSLEDAQSPQIAEQPRLRELSVTNQPRSQLEKTPETPRLTKQPERGVRFQNQGYPNGTDGEPASLIGPSTGQEPSYLQKTRGAQPNSQPRAQIRPGSDRGSQIPRLVRPSEEIFEQRDEVYSRNNKIFERPTEPAKSYNDALDPDEQNARASQQNAFHGEVGPGAIANPKAERQAAVSYTGNNNVTNPVQQEPNLSGMSSQRGKAASVDSASMNNARKGTGVAQLALADPSVQRTTSKEQKAWWEGDGSASRRRSGKFTNDSELPTGNLDGGTEPDNGKYLSFPQDRNLHMPSVADRKASNVPWGNRRGHSVNLVAKLSDFGCILCPNVPYQSPKACLYAVGMSQRSHNPYLLKIFTLFYVSSI